MRVNGNFLFFFFLRVMFFFIDTRVFSIGILCTRLLFKEADRFSKKKGVKKFSSCYRDSFDGILEIGILSFFWIYE